MVPILPGKSHGQRSLEGCSPWGRWGSDTTKRLHFHFSLSCTGEGNGNPLQCSCLENPRDKWWATIYGVTQSRTRLKWLSSSSSILTNMEKAIATHSRTLAWKIPWTEEPGRLQTMVSLRVGHDWETSLSRIREGNGTTPVLLPGESQGQGAWWAAVYGITQSWTRLKRLSSSSILTNKDVFEPSYDLTFMTQNCNYICTKSSINQHFYKMKSITIIFSLSKKPQTLKGIMKCTKPKGSNLRLLSHCLTYWYRRQIQV